MKTLYLSTLLFITACHSNDNSFGYANGDISDNFEVVPATQMRQASGDASEVTLTQKLIKRGGLTFESENINTDYNKIKSTLSAYQAYLESEEQSRSEHHSRYDLTIRVPSENYDSLIDHITHLAFKLESKYSNVEDVTERYYDLETRISNQKILEARYLELLKKASSIKDMLEIERNLTDVRTNIEQLEGQFKYLSKQIGFSTLNVSFYEQLPYVFNESGRKGFLARIASAFSSGWTGFLTFLVGLIRLWPFLILISLFVFIIQKWRIKRKNRKPGDE